MKAAFHIARKEFRLHLRSSRFLLTMLLCLLFIPFILFTGTDNYFTRQNICQQREATADSLLKNTYTWSQVRPLVIKKTEPLSIFSEGVTPNMGIHNQILVGTYPLLPHSFSTEDYSILGLKLVQVQGDTGNNDNIFLNTFSYTDFMGMIGMIFSLLALVFSHDTFSREKETGTLRMVFSSPVERLSFLFGKIGGVCMVLVPPVLFCYISMVGYLLYAGVSLQITDWNGILLLLLLTFSFILVFTLLGIFISLLVPRSEQALTISILFWMGIVFILPPVSGYLAETIAPLPLYRNVESKLGALNRERNQKMEELRNKYEKEEKVTNTMALFNEMGNDGSMDKWGMTKSHAHAILRTQKESEPLRVAYAERKWKLQKEYLEGLQRQIRLRHWIACLSPLQVFQETAQRLCRTAPESYLSYMEEVRKYRQQILDFFTKNRIFDSYSYFTIENDSDFMTDGEMEKLYKSYDNWSDEEKNNFMETLKHRTPLNTGYLPRFTQQTATVGEQGKSFLGGFLFFVAATLVLICLTKQLSARYDIR